MSCLHARQCGFSRVSSTQSGHAELVPTLPNLQHVAHSRSHAQAHLGAPSAADAVRLNTRSRVGTTQAVVGRACHLRLAHSVCSFSTAAAAITTWCAGEAVKAPAADLSRLRGRAAVLLDAGELKKQHWDPTRGMFLDWGRHTEGVQLQEDASGQVRTWRSARAAQATALLASASSLCCISNHGRCARAKGSSMCVQSGSWHCWRVLQREQVPNFALRPLCWHCAAAQQQ